VVERIREFADPDIEAVSYSWSDPAEFL